MKNRALILASLIMMIAGVSNAERIELPPQSDLACLRAASKLICLVKGCDLATDTAMDEDEINTSIAQDLVECSGGKTDSELTQWQKDAEEMRGR